jgi:hypothetical protein
LTLRGVAKPGPIEPDAADPAYAMILTPEGSVSRPRRSG